MGGEVELGLATFTFIVLGLKPSRVQINVWVLLGLS